MCGTFEETIKHLFVDCAKSKLLWNEVKTWIGTVNIQLDLNPSLILLGYINLDANKTPINTILTVVKYYIFYSAKQKRALNIFTCQNFLKKIYQEQSALSLIEDKEAKFRKTWARWEPLFI